ncbi:hypothetical protein [Armatimonas sp.]|uniref:hypothetical protein n=1 Tax=Armatimonas sp. TaxID=1872638 RepID=UPI00286D24F3|nr:hypothetical protein [Armatimonas sp.]
MNQQLQKQRTTHASINLLEGFLGTLHLLLGGGLGSFLLWLRESWDQRTWIAQLAFPLMVLFSLLTAIAGLLLLLRQRRIAYYAQLISALAAAVLVGLVTYQCLLGTRDGNTVWQVLVLYPFVALWMAWFAWFIKKQEESAE